MANMFHKFSGGIRIGSVANTTARDALTNVDAGSLIWIVSEAAFHQYDGSSWSPIQAEVLTEFADDVFRITDNLDPTKKIAFQANAIGPSTTRTIQMPDQDVNLGALIDSNISASAAIARSKLASGSASHVLINDVSGVMSSEAALAAVRGGLGTDASAFDGVLKASSGTFSASAIANADISASAAIAYSKLALTGSIANADISASAAIAYSKLALTGSIVNADISASAAIAESKLALDYSTSSLNTAINNAQSEVDALESALGAAISSAGAYVPHSGSNYIDGNTSVTADLLDLDAAAKAAKDAADAAQADVDDLVTLSGVAVNSTDLGTFTGITIPDGSTIKDALQSLETAVQGKAADADVIKKDGSVAFTADQSMGGYKLTNLASPTASTDAATKSYVDNLTAGLSWKQAARVATTSNINISTDLEAGDVIDGVTLAEGDRVLVKNQTSGAENGIYVVSASGPASRAADMDTSVEVPGAALFVMEGSTNADTQWIVSSNAPLTIGGDVMNWSQFGASVSYTAGDGLQLIGNEFSAKLDGTTLTSSASGLKVSDGGITNNEINASAAIAYSKLALTGSIANADISASAAIAESKLALDYSTSSLNTAISNKASRALDNLASVAINTSLLPDANTTHDLGSQVLAWNNTWTANLKSSVALEITAANGSSAARMQSSLFRRAKTSAGEFVEQEYVHSTALSASQSGQPIGGSFSCAVATYESVAVEYHMKQATTNRVRTGTLRIDSDGTNVTVTDVFNETADVGVTLDADINDGSLRILYSSGSNAVTMRADIKRYLTI